MSNHATQIAAYESIAALSGQMLRAAQHGDWQRVALLERDCRGLIERLRSAPPQDPLDAAVRGRKLELIRKVLANDAAIRDLAEPWMAELEALIGATGRRRRLQRAYGAGSG